MMKTMDNKVLVSEVTRPKCYVCGADLKEKGFGAFPYECIAKYKNPNAMVYDGCLNGHACGWSL